MTITNKVKAMVSGDMFIHIPVHVAVLIIQVRAYAALQIVAGHRSLLTIWMSWSVKIDADFLK